MNEKVFSVVSEEALDAPVLRVPLRKLTDAINAAMEARGECGEMKIWLTDDKRTAVPRDLYAILQRTLLS